MSVKSFFKKAISLTVMTAVLASSAACGNIAIKTQKYGIKTDEVPKATREEAFKEIVQSTVNKYGILDEDKAEKSSDLQNVSGLWDAKTHDLTGDGEDELFLVYLDNSDIHMQVYEYKKGTATKEWSEKSGWGGVFYMTVQMNEAHDMAYWTYGTSRSQPEDVFAFKDGDYISARSMGNYSDEEKAEISNTASSNYNEGNRVRDVLLKRFGIDPGSDASEYNIMELWGDAKLHASNTDELVSQWNLNIPEKRMSPTEILGNIQYYGDIERCKMTKEMAEAYAEAIESDRQLALNHPGASTYLKAVLIDLAGDGMPLLITSIAEQYDYPAYIEDGEAFYIWTWDGTKAEKYDFKKDLESQFTFGFDFYPGFKDKMIVVGDGIGGMSGCGGSMEYDVSNARITLAHHEMRYYAWVNSDTGLASCEELPGVSTAKRTDENFYEAPADDLLAAGWVGEKDGNGEYEWLYTRTINGEHAPYRGFGEMQNSVSTLQDAERINLIEVTTGGSTLLGEWSSHIDMTTALNSYSKIAGKPFYDYEEVSGTLSDKEVKAIAKKAAEKVKGKIGEIYRLSDDLYLVIIYVDREVSGSVILKNTQSGTDWRIVKSEKKAIGADDVLSEINKDSKASNIKIDLKKANDGIEYLTETLENIDGSKPNNTAKQEITGFIEAAVSQSSRVTAKAKGNKVTVDKKDIEKAVKEAEKATDEYKKILDDKGISLNKSVTVIIFVIVENMEDGKAMQVTLDKDIANALGDGNEIMLMLGDSNCSIKASRKDLRTILKEHGKLTITIKKSKDDSYEIQFADKDGKLIEKLPGSITIALPADNELCTIEAQYTGGTDNWGGQFDTVQKTLSFATPYSGTYTVIGETTDITDIENLSEEYQKAIRFMVSKGYFNLENDSFNPYGSLNRYAFSEALVRMFFALDRGVKSGFADITEDDPYYAYVASGESSNIIEGYEDNTFRGLNDVLIEEVLALCSRTLKEQKGYREPENLFDFLNFSDNDMISDWAQSEIALTVREGLIENGGMLHPQSTISRAEAALILYRLFMLLYEVEPVAVIANSSLGSTDAMILILGSAIGVLIIAIGVLAVILLKKRSKAAMPQDSANSDDAPVQENETADDK